LLSGNSQIIFGLAISLHCLQTISKYFGNFDFYEALTLKSKKEDRRTETESKVILGAKNTKIFESTILNMVDIFSKKSKKKCNKRYQMKKKISSVVEKFVKKNNRKSPPRFGRAASNLKSPYPKGRAAAF